MKASTEKITSDSFSSRLRDLMNDARIRGQDDLAGRLGVAQSTVSNWFKGEMPSRGNLNRLADFFRVSPRWLSAGEGPKDSQRNKSESEVLREMPAVTAPTRGKCVEHLEQFLDTCDTADKLGWTYIELTERFPLDKWKQRVSSGPAFGVEAAAVTEAERRYHEERGHLGYEPSSKADVPSAEKSGPSSGISQRSKDQHPGSQGKAPK